MKIWKTLRQWSRLFWFMGFIIMAMILTSAMWEKQSASIAEFHIHIDEMSDGGKLMADEEVRKMLKLNKEKQENAAISHLTIAEMEALLQAHPLVKRADVYIDARNRINVRIEHPELLLRVIDRRGAHYYISNEGKKVPLSKHHTPRIPVVTGDIPMFEDSLVHKSSHVLGQLFRLGEELQKDEFAKALVEQIHYVDGAFTIVPKMGSFRFILGGIRPMNLQLASMRTFYREILPTKGWDKYRQIDLRYKGQIVCRKA